MRTPKEELSISEVKFGTLKSGRTGISLGPEELFIEITYGTETFCGKKQDRWTLHLIDLEMDCSTAAAEFSVSKLADLRMSTKETKGFRAVLKQRYKDLDHTIELILITIDENEEQWKPGEREEEPQTPKMTELPAGKDILPETKEEAERKEKAEQEEFEELQKLAVDPTLEDRVLNDIHRTVKFDDHVIGTTFHTALSAYIEPLNLANQGESGVGKLMIR